MSEPSTCLSFWFPILQRAGIPVPRTEIVHCDLDLTQLLDGNVPDGWEPFRDRLAHAAEKVGYPCFLRTGQTSGKHEWRDTCYLECRADIGRHVGAIVEYSALADMLGLPTDVWAVREFLPLEHDFTAFRGMPVAKEYRVFVDARKVLCSHRYWPTGAIWNPSRPDWRECLERLYGDPKADQLLFMPVAWNVAEAFTGAWSVDIVLHRGQAIVTDMALAEQSWHWPDCPVGLVRWPQTCRSEA
jgi:hypothetical protein